MVALDDVTSAIDLTSCRKFEDASREGQYRFPWPHLSLPAWRFSRTSDGYKPLNGRHLRQLVKVKSNDFDNFHEHRDFKRANQISQFTLLGIFFLVANVFYFFSLRGAETPQELNVFLGQLGLFLISAVLFFSAQFWVSTILSSISTRWRIRNAILQLFTLGAWYFYDHGNRLQSHGAYNLLIFCIIFWPSNILLGFFYFWYLATSSNKEKRPRRFWSQLSVVLFASTIIVILVANKKQDALAYGFFDRRILCTGEERHNNICTSCQWQTATPWFDLLPIRMNAFTGPMQCPESDLFSASFTEDGKLNIDCPEQLTEARSWFNGSVLLRHQGAVYTVLPRTERLGLAFKRDSLDYEENPFQRHILEFAEARLRPYHGPVLVHDNTDTILALCGSAAPKILNRVVPATGSSNNAISKPKLEAKDDEDRLNVVTLFIDAVSRRQFHRRLPETRQVLERIVSASNATSQLFEFSRYHTVGFNTAPNTRALWAGLDEQDADNAGVPLWEQYQSSGYVSARVDPMCQDWTAYYSPAHFPNTTSTHIDQPRLSHEYLSWSCFPPYLPIGKLNSGNFAGPTSIKARCISGTQVGWHEINWMSKFVSKYRALSKPFYINTAFMEGHEGSGEVLRTLDTRLAHFLDPMFTPMDLNKTAVVIVSDHGALMGLNYAFFLNGKVEAANPAAIMLLPQWFIAKQGRAEHLSEATKSLITAHDLYETMKAFKGTEKVLSGEGDAELHSPPRRRRRGFNLLREDIGDRTCIEAGITETTCRCL